MDKLKLKYVDLQNKIFFPRMKYYPGGLALPNGENIINVTPGERKQLLRFSNHKKAVFEEVRERRPRIVEEKSEV